MCVPIRDYVSSFYFGKLCVCDLLEEVGGNPAPLGGI